MGLTALRPLFKVTQMVRAEPNPPSLCGSSPDAEHLLHVLVGAHSFLPLSTRPEQALARGGQTFLMPCEWVMPVVLAQASEGGPRVPVQVLGAVPAPTRAVSFSLRGMCLQDVLRSRVFRGLRCPPLLCSGAVGWGGEKARFGARPPGVQCWVKEKKTISRSGNK